jgi:hypothetical protein
MKISLKEVTQQFLVDRISSGIKAAATGQTVIE